MGEVITANEDYLTSQIIAAAISTSVQARDKLMAASRNSSDPPSSAQTVQGYTPDTYRRDAHAKSHGCVTAKFTVGRVDERFAYGLFAQPGAYDAIIRFSSGSPDLQPDSTVDARGMAIKVFGVCGKKLLPYEEDGTAQDFVLMNSPTFFIRTIEEYARFNAMLANGRALDYFYSLQTSPLQWHVRELILGKRTQKLTAGEPGDHALLQRIRVCPGPRRLRQVRCDSVFVQPADAARSQDCRPVRLRLPSPGTGQSGGQGRGLLRFHGPASSPRQEYAGGGYDGGVEGVRLAFRPRGAHRAEGGAGQYRATQRAMRGAGL